MTGSAEHSTTLADLNPRISLSKNVFYQSNEQYIAKNEDNTTHFVGTTKSTCSQN